jgi:ribosomal protein S18 acetylase RimI-like enzyme
MTINILPMTEKHIEGFWATLDKVAREQQYLAFLKAPPLAVTKAWILNNLRENWPHVVAMHEEKVIGWCDITGFDRVVFAHRGVMGMGLLPPYRGQGIGEALLQHALQLADLKGLTRIELTVREHNTRAIALYKKVGFETEGVQKNALLFEGQYENLLSMALCR